MRSVVPRLDWAALLRRPQPATVVIAPSVVIPAGLASAVRRAQRAERLAAQRAPHPADHRRAGAEQERDIGAVL